MYYTSSTAARRRKIVNQINLSLLMVKYGIPLLLLSGVVNWFLSCCGITGVL